MLWILFGIRANAAGKESKNILKKSGGLARKFHARPVPWLSPFCETFCTFFARIQQVAYYVSCVNDSGFRPAIQPKQQPTHAGFSVKTSPKNRARLSQQHWHRTRGEAETKTGSSMQAGV